MSDILHEDTFHGTKKGGRRKTVSKRRAYISAVSTMKAGAYPKKRVRFLKETEVLRNYLRNNDISNAQNELQALRMNWTWLSV